VTVFDTELHKLLDDMYDVGLAAIQIGIDSRVLIINIPIEDPEGENYAEERQKSDQPKENTLEMINPVIIQKDGLEIFQEGCLSIPGVYEDIERAKHVMVEYFDRNGQKQSIENDEFLAIAIQHEMDHLDGKKFEKEWKRKMKEEK